MPAQSHLSLLLLTSNEDGASAKRSKETHSAFRCVCVAATCCAVVWWEAMSWAPESGTRRQSKHNASNVLSFQTSE